MYLNRRIKIDKVDLKDRILLAIPNGCSMQPHKLEGGASEANINAIRQLRMEGLITAVGDSCGGLIKFELTDLGKLRKAELIRLHNRSIWQRNRDWCISAINNKWTLALFAWIFGIISALIVAYLSKKLDWI